MRRFLILAVGATLVLGLSALPASATVHEIVGQWCSGHDPLAPPGISGGSNADNFAQPLVANGFVGEPVPFEDGLLIPFNYDHPAAKVRGTGEYFVVSPPGSTPKIYNEGIEPDPNHPFANCQGLR